MTSLKDRRISRRALLAGSGAAAAGLGAAALVGCGDDDDDEAPAPAATQAATEAAATEAAATEAAATEAAATEAAATEAAATEAAATEAPQEGGPQTGGTLRGSAPTFIWNTGFPFSFTWENEPYFSVLEPLVRYRDSLEPHLVLAERFEYNDDRSKLTVTLKPDLEFHDGSPVTTQDVFHGIEVMLDPEPWGITGVFQISSFARTLTRWEAVDSRTMEFEFDMPRPNMTDFFAQLLVTKADTYRELQEGQNVQGTGPFAFEQWTPDVGASFVANRGWHKSADEGGGPYVDRIELQNFPDAESLGLALEAGDIDWSLGVAPSIARRTGQGFLAPKAGIVYVGCVTNSPKLVDPRVRQALLYAIDRRRMTEELREGFGDLTAQPWPSSSPAFDPDLESELYEPDRSRALLAEAGWSQDSPLMIEPIPGTEVTAQILKDNFADIGVDVEIVTQEIGVWVGKLRQRGFVDLWVAPHKFSNLSPLTTMQQTFPYRMGNPSYYETETYLDIIANLERLDPLGEDAREQYARFNRMWLEDPWLLPVHTNQRIEVANANVKGYDEHFVTIFEQPNLAKVWLEA